MSLSPFSTANLIFGLFNWSKSSYSLDFSFY
eukprot:UN1724